MVATPNMMQQLYVAVGLQAPAVPVVKRKRVTEPMDLEDKLERACAVRARMGFVLSCGEPRSLQEVARLISADVSAVYKAVKRNPDRFVLSRGMLRLADGYEPRQYVAREWLALKVIWALHNLGPMTVKELADETECLTNSIYAVLKNYKVLFSLSDPKRGKGYVTGRYGRIVSLSYNGRVRANMLSNSRAANREDGV